MLVGRRAQHYHIGSTHLKESGIRSNSGQSYSESVYCSVKTLHYRIVSVVFRICYQLYRH